MSTTRNLVTNLTRNLTRNLITGFFPSDISTKGFWLDSSDTSPTNIVNSGGVVSQWSDKFGNGRHATQSSSGDRSQTGVDQKAAKNVISFTRGNFMEIDYIIPENNFSIFAVVKSETSTGFDFYLAQADSSVDWALAKQNSNPYYATLNSGSIGAGTQPEAPDPIIMNLVNSRSGSTNTFQLYKNNVSVGTQSRDYANAATTITLGGKDDGGPGRFEGWIAEIIVYEKLLSEAERNQVYNYLNNKWFITFAAPNDVLDLKLWLDPSDSSTLTDSGGVLSEQADKSGNNYDFDQAASGDRPTTGSNTINGLNVINYDGTQFLENNSFASELAGNDVSFSIHLVYQATETGSPTYSVFGAGNTADDTDFYTFMSESSNNNQPAFRGRSGAGGSLGSVDFGSPDTSPHVISIIKKATTVTIYFDGFKVADDAAFNLNSVTLNTFTLGCLLRTSGEELNFKGNLGEFLFYGRENTEQEISNLHNYLANKWL